MLNRLGLGQLVCIGIPEEGISSEYKAFLKEYRPGNFIIFKRNTLGGRDALRELTNGLKESLRSLGLPPPFICVDQEGGPVCRLSGPHWPSLPSMEELAKARNPVDKTREAARATARILKDVGINVNLAPVLDLKVPGDPPVLDNRTFSGDPKEVAFLGSEYISTMQEQGVLAVGKHYPGIGGLSQDPHEKVAISKRDQRGIKEGLIPFEAAIKKGVFGLMTSHVVFPFLDPGRMATFSSVIAEKLLRNRLSFRGILFTDDLFMGAIKGNVPMEHAAAKALRAGHDILLFCHGVEESALSMDSLEKWMETDDLLKKRVLEGTERIVGQKRRMLKE